MHICVVTGTRAEYGILKPIMDGLKNNIQFQLSIIVTGMHLSNKFGNTIEYIEKDGFKIDKTVSMNPKFDGNLAMAISVGEGIVGISKALSEINPDMVLILGDRTEALSACIAAAYLNIPIVHFSGGDRTGGIDESVRHSITKFAHVHFPATEESANRIIKMGEDPSRVHVVGEPSIEKIKTLTYKSKNEIEKEYHVDLSKPLIILLQHSNTIESESAETQIKESLEALKILNYQTIIIYPNSDSGGRRIIDEIEKCSHYENFKIYKSLSHENFLNLLNVANCLVGNSSSGIAEAPSFKLPVVNIGTRQINRQRANNVIDVDYNRDQIINAIKTTLFDVKFKNNLKACINPYGDGNTSQKVLKILANIEINQNLLQKINSY